MTISLPLLHFLSDSKDIRYQVLKRGLAGWEKQQNGKRDRASQRVQHMSPTQTCRKKRKDDWYMSGGDCETVLFMGPMPKSVVTKKVERVAKRNGVKVNVVERAGITMKQLLQKSDPFPLTGCGWRACMSNPLLRH